MIDKCFECEELTDVDYHHVVPKSLGGIKTVPLCYKCHGLVHGKDFVKHRKLLRIGIDKAMAEGKYKGRMKGSCKTTEEYLALERSKNIIKLLDEGLSFRKIATLLSTSVGTVQKVKKLYNLKLTEEERNTPMTLISETIKQQNTRNVNKSKTKNKYLKIIKECELELNRTNKFNLIKHNKLNNKIKIYLDLINDLRI